jgi:hypothetical protein
MWYVKRSGKKLIIGTAIRSWFDEIGLKGWTTKGLQSITVEGQQWLGRQIKFKNRKIAEGAFKILRSNAVEGYPKNTLHSIHRSGASKEK